MRSTLAFLAFLRLTYSQKCTDARANNVDEEAACRYTIRVGNSAFDTYYGAYGIEFAVQQLNDMGGLKLGTNNVHYDLEYIQEGYTRHADDANDEKTHRENMEKLLDPAQDNIHFVVGSHPSFAPTDVKMTNEAKVIQMMCCVGPNPLYEAAVRDYPDFNGIYGIHTPPEKYPIAPLTEAALHGAKTVALMYRNLNKNGQKNIFTTHVCEMTRIHAIEVLGMQVVYYESFNQGDDADDVRELGRQAAERKPDAFIGCFIEGDYAVAVAEELDSTGTDIGLRFMTVAPTYGDWVDDTKAGVAGHYVSTGGQWHSNSQGCGRWFHHLMDPDADPYCGKTFNKDINKYMTQTRSETVDDFSNTYVSTSGAVALFTLIDAIKQAYDGEVHTPLDFEGAVDGEAGRAKIQTALNLYNEETFFGAMDFDEFQRNTAKEAVNSQWLPKNGDATKKFTDYVTHPMADAQTKMVYPVPYQPMQYAGAGCNDEAALNYKAGDTGRDDCRYELVVGAALYDEYQASWGIAAAADQLNAINMVNDIGGGLQLGSNKVTYHVTYKHFSHFHAQKDTEEDHAEQVRKMLRETTFTVGSGPWYAAQEVNMTNAAGRVNILCCTGPDPVYERASQDPFNGAFGIHAPPEYYPMDAIRHAAVNGAKKIAFAYGNENVFTRHVCQMNRQLAEDLEMDVVLFESFKTTTNKEEADAQDATFEKIATDAINRGAEVFIGCTFVFDAVSLAKKLSAKDNGYVQLETVFFTVGPTQGNWLEDDRAGEAGRFVTTGGQWDKNYDHCGDWFGEGWPGHSESYCGSDWNTYVEAWVKAQEDSLIPSATKDTYQSDYETASGAVAFYTLMDALVSAYKNEVHKPQHFSQEKVRDALRTYKGRSFFGNMEFNNIQRNVAKDTVAAQYLPTLEDEDVFDKFVVFPEEGRERPFAFPIVTYSHPEIEPEEDNCPTPEPVEAPTACPTPEECKVCEECESCESEESCECPAPEPCLTDAPSLAPTASPPTTDGPGGKNGSGCPDCNVTCDDSDSLPWWAIVMMIGLGVLILCALAACLFMRKAADEGNNESNMNANMRL